MGVAIMTETLLTVDQYFDHPDTPGTTSELINGRLVEVSMPAWDHCFVQASVIRLLGSACDQISPDLVVGGPTGYLLSPGTVQGPDVSVVSRRLVESSGTYRGALRCAPALAVAVVSPSESAADLDDKVANYLEAGTAVVWVLWPRRRHALIYEQGGAVRNVTAGQFLDAPAVMPGVRIALDDVFAALTGRSS